jgi:hypothetical protein
MAALEADQSSWPDLRAALRLDDDVHARGHECPIRTSGTAMTMLPMTGILADSLMVGATWRAG